MKTKEELTALRREIETLNKKLAELNEGELKQVTGGGQDSRELNSKDVYNIMFGYISQNDEFHAVYMYRSKGFLLEAVDSEQIHIIFKQLYGYEIEESPYYNAL